MNLKLLKLEYMTGKRTTRKFFSNKGFTLMEIVIVVAVFSITTLLAVDLIVTYSKLQKRTIAQQTIGSDARFITETIARQYRLGTTDYDYYEDPDDKPLPYDFVISANDGNNATDPDDDMPIQTLALKDQAGQLTLYELLDNAGVGQIIISTDRGTTWTPITPNSIDVDQFDIYLFPYRDPFALEEPITETSNIYQSDDQPRITIIMTTTSLESKPPVSNTIQTMISSRLYAR
ncbi:type II secretion system protein [Patescibacteria group bacterium]